MHFAIIAAALLSAGKAGVELTVSSGEAAAAAGAQEGATLTIDPARSVFLDVELKTPPGIEADLPDFRDRARGFSLAEPFEEAPSRRKDGATIRRARWRLVPEPCAKEYKIAPFAIEARGKDAEPFLAGPLKFLPPAERAKAEGPLEISPEKDFPPLSWRLVGACLAWLAAAVAAAAAVAGAVKYAARRVREHLMSPIERARAELDRLVRKGLPGRGRYKDFYVELTMVVRRYVQRKYGVKAPHLTTGEFFAELENRGLASAGSDSLKEFLESADLVKFAGLEATPGMADDATGKARTYLENDNAK